MNNSFFGVNLLNNGNSSVWKRFRRWSRSGIWEKVFDKLKSKDEEIVTIDSSSVRVHQEGIVYGKGLEGGVCLEFEIGYLIS